MGAAQGLVGISCRCSMGKILGSIWADRRARTDNLPRSRTKTRVPTWTNLELRSSNCVGQREARPRGRERQGTLPRPSRPRVRNRFSGWIQGHPCDEVSGAVPKRTLETDYLVIGCGAAGMAFADSLIDASRAEIVMVDRRNAPGGHWLEAYPFVRLHQPSSFYGVNSLPLGSETIDRHGPNEGFYERAGAAEICGYYDRVMRERLLPSGRVRYFPMSSYLGEHRFVSTVSGEEVEVKVRKKLVDASYLEGRVPASSPPPFEVAAGAQCVPVGALASVRERPAGYVVIGAGKTALDACTWLLDCGVPPSDIRWIKPREGWFLNRRYWQGGELVGTMFEGISLQLEAAAQATSTVDL